MRNQHKIVDMLFDGYSLHSKRGALKIEQNIVNNNITNKKSIRNILNHMCKNGIDVIGDESYVLASQIIVEYKHEWVRDPFEWVSKYYNSDKNISDFIHHIFCKYDTPRFFDSIFLKSGLKNYIDIFLWMSKGNSLKKYKFFPIPMTKKMMYYFSITPNHFSIEEAFILSYVLGVGGNEQLFKYLMVNNRINNFQTFKNNFELWSDVIYFFSKQYMMNYNEISPLIDYIWFHVHEENPYFTTKNRTLSALLRNSYDWHYKVSKAKKKINYVWEGFDIPDYFIKMGKDEHKREYSITQIKTTKELISEGRELNHCVSSYARDCGIGATSIWSFKIKKLGNPSKRLLTIELNKDYVINQIKGAGNRASTQHERNIIGGWASENNLSFSKWAFRGR